MPNAADSTSSIRLGTRASKLAMWQSNWVKSQLEKLGHSVELIQIKTEGDVTAGPLAQIGGQGLFTKQLQIALLEEQIDLAVHSLKDLPTQEHSGLQLAGIPARADRFDVLLLPNSQPLASLEDLPNAARIGTGSPRRQAQLKFHLPHLTMLEIRGNLQTRLRRLDEGDYDAIVLAAAGLKRLNLESRIALRLEPPLVLPAVGQGALGIECRPDDELALKVLDAISVPEVVAETTAERSLLFELRAGCHAPLGVATTWENDGRLTLSAVLLNAEGTERWQATATGRVENAEQLGVQVANRLRDQGGKLAP